MICDSPVGSLKSVRSTATMIEPSLKDRQACHIEWETVKTKWPIFVIHHYRTLHPYLCDMKSAAAFLIRASALLFGLALATDLYVSTTGSDSNAGNSAGQPFRTLTKAQNAVRALATQSMSDDITVHLASGIYILSEPLRFNGADSGKNGHTVSWVGDGATLSGGLRVTGWKQESNGIYSASVPTGTESRNLYVGGWAANYARTKLDNRTQFTYTANGMTWSDSRYDWLMSTPGIANAEIRFINSFTDRVAPIRAVGNRQLSMRQYAWANQIIGWDHAASPFADFGVYVQNALALLTDGGEFYLDTAAAKVYYKPLAGENMATIDTYLGVQETLIAVGGTYGEPAHDISFSGIKFVSPHSPLPPSSSLSTLSV